MSGEQFPLQQGWNFLFWQPPIWVQNKRNSNFRSNTFFRIFNSQYDSVSETWLKSVLKLKWERESMEIVDENQDFIVPTN